METNKANDYYSHILMLSSIYFNKNIIAGVQGNDLVINCLDDNGNVKPTKISCFLSSTKDVVNIKVTNNFDTLLECTIDLESHNDTIKSHSTFIINTIIATYFGSNPNSLMLGR